MNNLYFCVLNFRIEFIKSHRCCHDDVSLQSGAQIPIADVPVMKIAVCAKQRGGVANALAKSVQKHGLIKRRRVVPCSTDAVFADARLFLVIHQKSSDVKVHSKSWKSVEIPATRVV